MIQTVELGSAPWPTVDPFLFCVHHRDDYPAGDERMAPVGGVAGRDLGMDFSGKDGWSMYHGAVVPGFPQHPHRGFETVTHVRRGYVDHSDSLGATARFGRGDVQWLTAGGGIVHSEMFPLVESEAGNPTELFQIWLNLPADDKLVDPHFSMLWDEDIPRIRAEGVEVTVIAGTLAGETPPPPPPRSWASRTDSDVAIWHVVLEPGASWTLPAASDGTVRMLYLFDGAGLAVEDHVLGARTGAAVEADRPVGLTAGDERVEVLVLQGRPIAEPVAQYGPFVMNDREGIEQAFADYRRTGFGGWPFADDAPTHPRDEGRFARHADGRVEQAPAEVPA
ncbi:MAG TPA: pirin family protein [Acidimicrobiales bacterium]|nr:pirin family protein [Acidimicrobiales bacterium]